MHLSIYRSIDLSIYRSIDLLIYRRIDRSIDLSIYLDTCGISIMMCIHAPARTYDVCVCLGRDISLNIVPPPSRDKSGKYSLLGAHGFCMEHGHPVLGSDATFAPHMECRIRNMSHEKLINIYNYYQLFCVLLYITMLLSL